MNDHFCNCPVTDCKLHPRNQDSGCDLCIKKNIAKKEIPSCFFRVVKDDVSEVKDFTVQGFVDFFLKNKES